MSDAVIKALSILAIIVALVGITGIDVGALLSGIAAMGTVFVVLMVVGGAALTFLLVLAFFGEDIFQ